MHVIEGTTQTHSDGEGYDSIQLRLGRDAQLLASRPHSLNHHHHCRGRRLRRVCRIIRSFGPTCNKCHAHLSPCYVGEHHGHNCSNCQNTGYVCPTHGGFWQ